MIKECKYCGKKFEGLNSTKFCSESCKSKARYKKRGYIKVCPVCGSEFVGNGKKKYCSLICASRVEYKYYQKKGTGNKDTLCWYCKNACGNCSWSRSFEPVKGWKAKKTKIKEQRSGCETVYEDSYIVKKCPMFERG